MVAGMALMENTGKPPAGADLGYPSPKAIAVHQRVLTAFLLITLSLCLAFTAGRMSVWVAPLAGVSPSTFTQAPATATPPQAAAEETRLSSSRLGMIEGPIGGAQPPVVRIVPSVASATKRQARDTSGAVALKTGREILSAMEIAAPRSPVLARSAPSEAPVVINATPMADGAHGSRSDDGGR
jgi:hypothetical protein